MSGRLRRLAAGLALAGVMAFALAGPGRPLAQAQGSGWSEPALVFETTDTLRTPALVADRYGQVHAFWVLRPDDAFADIFSALLYYARLDLPEQPPVDLFTGDIRGLQAAAGAGGLTLLWTGANYSLAGPKPLVSARSWTAPDNLASAYDNGGIATGPDGAVWIAYGVKDSGAVFAQRLDPEARDWGSPQLVAPSANFNGAPDAVHIAAGADGSLHVVWSEYQLPGGWPPLGLYYSRSTDGGQIWSAPLRFASGEGNQPNVLTGPEGQVYLAWTGVAGIGGKYFQESLNGGNTWEPPVDVLAAGTGGGSEGAPVLKLDSAGSIHMVYSNAGCVWHVGRTLGSWSAPECVSGGIQQDIEEPTMDIGLGNQIHVLYWTRDGQMWLTSRTLPVPALDPLPLPTEQVPTATAVIPTPTPAPSPTPLPDFGPPPSAGQPAEASLWALAAGVVPAVVLVLLVLAQRGRRNIRN
jgi:hypothetical protein